jgi:hypothetical protein
MLSDDVLSESESSSSESGYPAGYKSGISSVSSSVVVESEVAELELEELRQPEPSTSDQSSLLVLSDVRLRLRDSESELADEVVPDVIVIDTVSKRTAGASQSMLMSSEGSPARANARFVRFMRREKALKRMV